MSGAGTAQSVLGQLGVDNEATDALGIAADVGQAGDKYGGAAWDALAGDFAGAGNLATGAVGAGLGAKAAMAFMQAGATNTAGKVGSAVGAMVGSPFLGPVGSSIGAIFGGIVGNVAGSVYNSITGNADVDTELSFSSGTEGFENNQYFTTSLGNIGYGSAGTRNMNNQEIGGRLAGMQKVFTELDSNIAAGLTPEELNSVKGSLDGFKVNNANRAEYGSDPAKAMLKVRMESIKKALTPERLASSGFDKIIEDYNAQFTGLSPEQAQEINTAVTQFNNYRNVDQDDWGYKRAQGSMEDAQATLSGISKQYLGEDITDARGQDYEWYDRLPRIAEGYGARPSMQV